MVVAHEILLSALGLGVVSILYFLFYSQVPGSRSQVLGPRSQVPGSRSQVPGPRSQVPSPSPSRLTKIKMFLQFYKITYIFRWHITGILDCFNHKPGLVLSSCHMFLSIYTFILYRQYTYLINVPDFKIEIKKERDLIFLMENHTLVTIWSSPSLFSEGVPFTWWLRWRLRSLPC